MKNEAVSREAWLELRKALLSKEKELTRLRDEISRQRRSLPWVKLEQDYIFGSKQGTISLADAFSGRSQLIVYHFMLGPDWANPCKSCSFWAEHFDGIRTHLRQRDVELVAVSRAPVSAIEEIRNKMGWRFPWLSSLNSNFNFDFGVSFREEQDGEKLYNFGTLEASKGELPGLSVFVKSEGSLFHTYSTYARGLDALNGTYQLLDLVPAGRAEDGLRYPMAWLKLKWDYL